MIGAGFTDFPPGKWSQVLVGGQWPSSSTLEMLTNAIQQRTRTAAGYNEHAEQLANALTGPLANQEGVTAEATQQAFKNGRDHSRTVAEKNSAKSSAYSKAHQAISELQSELRTIAHDQNEAIEKVEKSKADPATKLAAIVQHVMTGQTQANQKGAARSSDILDGVQEVLRQEGIDTSAQDFVKGLGFDMGGAFKSPSEDAVTNQVKALMDGPKQSPLEPGGGREQPLSDSMRLVGDGRSASSTATQAAAPMGGSMSEVAEARVGSETNNSPIGNTLTGSPAGMALLGQDRGIATTTNLPRGSAAQPGLGAPSLSPVSSPTGSLTGATSSLPTGGGASAPSANVPSFQPITPQQLAESFNHGVQSGAPLSAGAEAISQGAVSSIQPQVAHQPDFVQAQSFSPSTTPTSGGFFATETASAAPPAADTTSYAAPATPAPAMYTAAPAAPMPSAPAPAGPLPAYGADLRPPTPTISAPGPTPVTPSPTMPTSAPMNPAGGAAVNPAVVQKAAAAATAPTATPTGVTESALAATTVGATSGVAAAQHATQVRLRTVVEAVARQQPKLRWAAGELEDGTITLVTDLASGWIPPLVQIPAGVRILEPAQRRGGLEGLLKNATTVETWQPGQYLPLDKDAAPVSMSLRARDLPAVDDLNWELTQATNWRDGLPRLAHTLAKAGIAGTGVLDSETELLHEHLSAVSEKVLNAYPGTLDTTSIGNWQLLAAIAALVAGQKTTLNYHFAWFQALNMATQGGGR